MQRSIPTTCPETRCRAGHRRAHFRLRGPVGSIVLAVAVACAPAAFAHSPGRNADAGHADTRLSNPRETPQAEELWDDKSWDEEEWEEEENQGRSFLFRELVASFAYSSEGVPPDGNDLDFSPRPPGSYIGLDWITTFNSSSPINKKLFPEWLQLTAIDLHPRIAYDRMEMGDWVDELTFAPQDFWLKFNVGGKDRLSLRVGQFVIPYGANPILAPRQMFILPVEATDLGLKWDWGLGLKGPAGDYDWEIAATIGSGESLHSSHLFRNDDRSSYLLTGRFGTPTYWDFQYGFSLLYGDLPVIMGPNVLSEAAISRWRVAFDLFYKHGTYVMFGGQVTYGQNGFDGDEKLITVTGGQRAADVLGSRAWMDWVLPRHNNFRLRGQLESVIRDLSTSESDDTAAILELSYSLTTSITLMVDHRVELNRMMGDENDTLFFSFIYYGR